VVEGGCRGGAGASGCGDMTGLGFGRSVHLKRRIVVTDVAPVAIVVMPGATNY
jgi:hypothetical protein